MKVEKIKPIPKYIEKLIIKAVKKDLKLDARNTLRFYSYLTKNDGELVKITVATKQRYGKIYLKQCAVHGIDSTDCFVKDMVYHMIAGYKVGWHDMGFTKYPSWFEDGKWDYSEDKYFDPFAIVVNMDYLKKIPKYKYAAWELYYGDNILKYLRIYNKYPHVEYLMKLGLVNIATKKTILEKVAKDKKFRTWIIQHREELKSKYHYTTSIIQAYKRNKPIDEMYFLEKTKKEIISQKHYKDIKELFNGNVERFIYYMTEQKTNIYSYWDYIIACKELGLDLTQERNLIPHDFHRWHDIRIDEYHSKQVKDDEEKRKALYDKFLLIASKYLPLQKLSKSDYVVIIAKSPKELINEGEVLHHCVGRMGYDQKFAREESLIFFIRNKETPDTPFVTLEYSLEKHSILQCYGDRDSKPDNNVIEFVNKTWLPYANRKIKKLQEVA